jgi:hypothetical protein
MKAWAVLTLFLLGAMTLLAKHPTTEVQVQVKNERGAPVERAAVILDFLSTHRQVFKLGRREPIHWEVRTNMEGIARFPSIPQGTIRVQVIAKNYQTFGKKFDVDDPQKTIDVTLNPPQKQYTIYGPSTDTSEPHKQ